MYCNLWTCSASGPGVKVPLLRPPMPNSLSGVSIVLFTRTVIAAVSYVVVVVVVADDDDGRDDDAGDPSPGARTKLFAAKVWTDMSLT